MIGIPLGRYRFLRLGGNANQMERLDRKSFVIAAKRRVRRIGQSQIPCIGVARFLCILNHQSQVIPYDSRSLQVVGRDHRIHHLDRDIAPEAARTLQRSFQRRPVGSQVQHDQIALSKTHHILARIVRNVGALAPLQQAHAPNRTTHNDKQRFMRAILPKPQRTSLRPHRAKQTPRSLRVLREHRVCS